MCFVVCHRWLISHQQGYITRSPCIVLIHIVCIFIIRFFIVSQTRLLLCHNRCCYDKIHGRIVANYHALEQLSVHRLLSTTGRNNYCFLQQGNTDWSPGHKSHYDCGDIVSHERFCFILTAADVTILITPFCMLDIHQYFFCFKILAIDLKMI